MQAIRVGRIKGGKIEHNSMCEKDLSGPVNEKMLVSTSRGIRIPQQTNVQVPYIIGSDIDITKDPLYAYLLRQ